MRQDDRHAAQDTRTPGHPHLCGETSVQFQDTLPGHFLIVFLAGTFFFAGAVSAAWADFPAPFARVVFFFRDFAPFSACLIFFVKSARMISSWWGLSTSMPTSAYGQTTARPEIFMRLMTLVSASWRLSLPARSIKAVP